MQSVPAQAGSWEGFTLLQSACHHHPKVRKPILKSPSVLFGLKVQGDASCAGSSLIPRAGAGLTEAWLHHGKA